MFCGRFTFYMLCILLPVISMAQNRYDILITEFLADPTPSHGLPESEFVELKNRSSQDYNLRNWKISNGTVSVTIKSDYLLKADSFLILCSTSAAAAYSQFGPTLGISGFPSLYNDAGEILLSSDVGTVMHAIQYDKSWFENALKADGGWSLEMVDLSKPCRNKENWAASVSDSGGTPGHANSVDGVNPDERPPSLLRAITLDSLDLTLLFDEPVDSSSASNKLNYSISDGMGHADSAFTVSPFFDRVSIRLTNPLSAGKIYTISLQQIEDCSGNEIGPNNTCKAGLPEKVKGGDIIFNEILFNPPPYGYDYLELFNRGPRIINCSGLFVAGKNMDGSLNDPIALVKEERSFFPGDYILLTENADWILQNYPMSDSAKILSLPSLPSLPDDMGKVVLLNTAGESLDELDYDHHWHSPLLTTESGVALERIRMDLPTSLATNWASAAASAGYGTPGYKNSESSADSGGTHFISIDPKIFSPDMDGYQDFCFINYNLPQAGFMGSISIYDTYGRLVRNLVNNTIWATSGTFRWDGLDDQQNLLPIGHYIIYVELFLLDGTVRKQTMVCVLARKR
jgi:Lamin Tail Domain/Bacterial Ig-like domain